MDTYCSFSIMDTTRASFYFYILFSSCFHTVIQAIQFTLILYSFCCIAFAISLFIESSYSVLNHFVNVCMWFSLHGF